MTRTRVRMMTAVASRAATATSGDPGECCGIASVDEQDGDNGGDDGN